MTEIAATCLVHMSAIKIRTGSVYVWDRQSKGKCPSTPYLTNLASTDLAFAIWSEPAVMWRALYLDSVTQDMLSPQHLTPVAISGSDEAQARLLIPHLFNLKYGLQTCPVGQFTFNGIAMSGF